MHCDIIMQHKPTKCTLFKVKTPGIELNH